MNSGFVDLRVVQIADDLQELRAAIEGQLAVETVTVYVDDASSLAPHGLSPVDPTNPWQIKMLIDNLDAQRNAREQEIRYVLIVGGDEIIPFHRLPNPIDDQDAHVPSDNPYASRDGNYLVPERAVGRLPDGRDGDVAYLRSLIRTAIEAHRGTVSQKGLFTALRGIFGSTGQGGEGLGYSASIWRKAARAVFEVIGANPQLRISPPLTYQEFEVEEPPRFSYFNLHGVEDGPNWYGQRDTLFPADYPLFPVALRPEDLTASEHGHSIVFTEACYGANVMGKTAADSIALRFLGLGALAVVGSTKVAYGAISPPLLGADLVGRRFWEGIQDRLSAGEALKAAKVRLARDMQERQGYLDGEDQKSLVSFVLYGDPSLPVAARPKGMAGSESGSFCPPIICQRRSKAAQVPLSDSLIATVKSRVESSLPHMAQAQVRACPVQFCSGECDQGCAPSRGAAKVPAGQPESWAVTLEKDIPVRGDRTHRQVIKLTVDSKGHVLKAVVSR